MYVTEPRLDGPLDAGLWLFIMVVLVLRFEPIPAMLTPLMGVRAFPVPLEMMEFLDSERCKPAHRILVVYAGQATRCDQWIDR